MTRKDIINLFVEIIEPLHPLMLVEYGDRKGRDFDIFVVFEKSPLTMAEIGPIDYTAIGRSQFEHLLSLFDIVVTEPIVTGSPTFDNNSEFISYREKLIQQKPTHQVINYLVKRSLEELLHAHMFIEEYEKRNESYLIRSALYDLSFSCSYLLSARHYSKKASSIFIFRDALEGYPFLRRVREYISSINNGTSIEIQIIYNLINDWEKHILSID